MTRAESITDPHRQPIVAVFADWGSVSSAFREFGARVVPIDDDDLSVLQYVDAIVLTGGGDVDPERYGAKPHRQNYGTSPARDAREFAAVEYAKKNGLPMFGICRGLQLLNVAHGGSLDQHIGDNDEAFSHEGTHHFVKLRRASRFTQHTGLVGLSGTHLHHQRIERLGEGLVPVGWAHDGTIEFIESAPNNPNIVLATQFHPEMDYDFDDDAGYIFAHFLKLVSKRMKPDVLGRWKKVKPKPKAIVSYDYTNPTQAKGAWVKDKRTGAWNYELPLASRTTTGETTGTTLAGTERDDYTNWWNEHRYTEWDEDDYLEWEKLNDMELLRQMDQEDLDDHHQELCDRRCAFPPCKDFKGCTAYGDCAAEEIALIQQRPPLNQVQKDRTTLVNMSVDEYERMLANKRGSGRL